MIKRTPQLFLLLIGMRPSQGEESLHSCPVVCTARLGRKLRRCRCRCRRRRRLCCSTTARGRGGGEQASERTCSSRTRRIGRAPDRHHHHARRSRHRPERRRQDGAFTTVAAVKEDDDDDDDEDPWRTRRARGAAPFPAFPSRSGTDGALPERPAPEPCSKPRLTFTTHTTEERARFPPSTIPSCSTIVTAPTPPPPPLPPPAAATSSSSIDANGFRRHARTRRRTRRTCRSAVATLPLPLLRRRCGAASTSLSSFFYEE
jgi:hypothetical protein